MTRLDDPATAAGDRAWLTVWQAQQARPTTGPRHRRATDTPTWLRVWRDQPARLVAARHSATVRWAA